MEVIKLIIYKKETDDIKIIIDIYEMKFDPLGYTLKRKFNASNQYFMEKVMDALAMGYEIDLKIENK